MKEHALKISSAAIALIKKHQGLSLEKYRDEKGLWVIGYGHVLSAIRSIFTALSHLWRLRLCCAKISGCVKRCCGKI